MIKKNRRFFSISAALILCFQALFSFPVFGNNVTVNPTVSSKPNDILKMDYLSEYDNLEVLVTYADGSMQVYSYDSQDELSSALDVFATDPDISQVQPNYSYTTEGTLTNDQLSGEQWALYNNGSFEMESQDNSYPVYDKPFSTPSAPGKWINPSPRKGDNNDRRNHFSTHESASTTTTLTSVSGIDINIQQAWKLYGETSKKETIIALIDTGIDTTHQDFGDVFWTNEDEIAGNNIDDDGNGYIDDVNGWNFYSNSKVIYTGSEDNHGTHGAGSIAATSDNSTGISGIVSDGSVKIMVLKALGGNNGSGTTDAVIKAIRYAESNGARICNLSMGTTSYDQALYNTMAASDMLFIVSAGNDGTNNDAIPAYPASFNLKNIISVANLSPDGELHASSNYGHKSVDIAVPGTYILSLTSDDSYSYMSGTSMSAPILSAVAAMLFSACDGLNAEEAKTVLLNTAAPLSSLSGKVLTGGMLDAGAALSYVVDKYRSDSSQALGTDVYGDLPFTDVSIYNEAYTAISYLYRSGVMAGTGATTFSPNTTLTRAMAVTLLGRIASTERSEISNFTDVIAGAWYSGYIDWAVDKGIVVGYGDGTFGTNDAVTATQLNLMLTRYAASLGYSYSSSLSGDNALTRAETAQALYSLCKFLSSK